MLDEIISFFHGCMVWIEKSVTRVTDRHHEACLVMPNSDPEWQIFLSTPYTHDRYFFLHTFWLISFGFQSRTCYEITLFPFKGFHLSLKKSKLPASTVRFLTLTCNLHKVTSFSDVKAVNKPTSLDDVDSDFLYNLCIKYTWFLSGPGWDNMGEIRIGGPGNTRGYPYPVCKKKESILCLLRRPRDPNLRVNK